METCGCSLSISSIFLVKKEARKSAESEGNEQQREQQIH